MSEEAATQCDRFEPLLPELALGILSGRERAEALAHIESCPRCSAELEELSVAADGLLRIAPEAEPPAGFELRVMEHLGPGGTRRQRRSPRKFASGSIRVAAAAVAAAFAALGIGIAELASGPTVASTASIETTPGGHLNVAHLVGQASGEVYTYSGSRPWLFMTVEAGSWSGEVNCVVVLRNGKSLDLGGFWVSSGYGAWGASLPAGARHVHMAQVVQPGGSIMAMAQVEI